MASVLIVFAHPAFQKSRVNRALVTQVQQIPGVTFHDLYEAYPELDIDVQREQQLLSSHEVIVFHHPFFWYSTPAVLKEWQDLVLEHGWAYGSGGTALQGKRLLSAITTGGGETAYQADGYNRFTIRHLLTPIEQTAYLCGMDYLPPFVVHGTHLMPAEEISAHAEGYRRLVTALRDEGLVWERVHQLTNLNTDLSRFYRSE